MKQIWNGAWVFCGTVCVGLGILGMFLPVLPTIPFLLLALYFYGRGSKPLYNWLVNHPWIGNYLKNYRDGKGIPLGLKLLSIALLWLTMGITIFLPQSAWWLKILLLVVTAGVTFHLSKFKTHHYNSRNSIMRDNSI